MKAIISNKIYMTVDQSMYKDLEKELTYKIPSYNDAEQFITIKNLKLINSNIAGGKLLVAFPSGRTDLIPTNAELNDKRVDIELTNFPTFGYKLRDSQQYVVDNFTDSCIINAKPGWGKTVAALAIAAKLKQKTLIVTHTVDLRTQWEREIMKVLNIKPGVIGSGKFNTDSPIVVANVQTLVKHTSKIARDFGLVILDEMHHVSSPTFSAVIDAMFARYKVGLSGTIERKDQKHVVFKDYFGMKLFKPERENVIQPEIHVYNTGIGFIDGYSTPWATKVNTLLESQLYRDLVIRLADYYSNNGYKVITVADRVEFLKYCHDNSINPSGLLVGETKDRDKVVSKILTNDINQIWGTQSMLSEGISIEPLSCLILATPVNNMPLLEQLIGRIERIYPNKKKPVVVDLRLEGNTVSRQHNNRISHYSQLGYDIKFIK